VDVLWVVEEMVFDFVFFDIYLLDMFGVEVLWCLCFVVVG